MAYAEATPTGTSGSQFRWFVSMVRSYIGTAAENYETWQLEGGVNRIATGGTGYSGSGAYYSLDAGTFAPGESTYGYTSVNFTNSVGRKFTVSLPNLTIERFADGTALSATADFYMDAGFVGVGYADATVGWSTNTVSRQALVTATSGNIYETDNPTITFTNPAGFTTDVYLELIDLTGTTQYALRTNVTSPYTWTLTTPERDALRTAMANTNSTSLGYFVKTNVSGGLYNGTFSTLTIDNRSGIASPTFTTWSVTDTTSAVAATSGGNPIMVQGKSVARATVTTGNKAVATKQATMSSYTFSVGPSSQSVAYSSVSTVTKDIDLATDAPDISGSQAMSLSAVDSRTNSTSVTNNVLVLPYAAPTFYPTIKVAYTNRFDISGGLSVTLPSSTNLVSFSPLNYSSTDYNVINTTSGVQYQLHKDTINSGNPWNNITTATTTGTGVQTVTAATLATAILSTMNSMGADNEVTWYVIFKVVDKYNTVTFQATIDIGAPIFRIGVDGSVYNSEKRILNVGDYDNGWTTLHVAPNSITALGQRSYTVVLPSVDYTDRLSPGMRLKLNRTVTAPTQCTSLNGSIQYYSKTSPSGMTFTDDFVVSALIKPASYAAGFIASRVNGTQGWGCRMNADGTIEMFGTNASLSNYSTIKTLQSVPLNRWSHIAAQLDMSSFTATTTTSYIMIDGVDVPCVISRAGTNPTALVQAGNLEIGSQNGGATPFNGKLAQVAIFNAKVTQATIRSYRGQTLTGSETSLISAYTFNNSINDLSANANNLTANGSAVATAVDTPFSNGVLGTTEYGIVMAISYSSDTTLTVQVPEGCALPTTGGISSVSYSGTGTPYGFPAQEYKWEVGALYYGSMITLTPTRGTWYNHGQLVVPAGSWSLGFKGPLGGYATGSTGVYFQGTLSETSSTQSTDPRLLVFEGFEASSATLAYQAMVAADAPVALAAATTYYLNDRQTAFSSGTAQQTGFVGGFSPTQIYAKNAYL